MMVWIAVLGSLPGCKPANSAKMDEWVDSIREKVGGKNDQPKGSNKSAASKEKSSFTAKYEASQARAVSEFPELGVAGSPFNAEFLARVKALKAEDIKYFNNPEWPYDLAKRVGEVLHSRTLDPNTVSTILISQRPSLYVGQWVTTFGTVVRVTGMTINSPIILEMEGGVRLEVSPEQFVAKRGEDVGEWSDRNVKLDVLSGSVTFLSKKGVATEAGKSGGWSKLLSLSPGVTLTVKGQVTRAGDRLEIKAAKLLDCSEGG